MCRLRSVKIGEEQEKKQCFNHMVHAQMGRSDLDNSKELRSSNETITNELKEHDMLSWCL